MTVTNILIILNLGCEMLYVIDQRLKAQSIPLDKSAQGKNGDRIAQRGAHLPFAILIGRCEKASPVLWLATYCISPNAIGTS